MDFVIPFGCASRYPVPETGSDFQCGRIRCCFIHGHNACQHFMHGVPRHPGGLPVLDPVEQSFVKGRNVSVLKLTELKLANEVLEPLPQFFIPRLLVSLRDGGQIMAERVPPDFRIFPAGVLRRFGRQSPGLPKARQETVWIIVFQIFQFSCECINGVFITQNHPVKPEIPDRNMRKSAGKIAYRLHNLCLHSFMFCCNQRKITDQA
ncbi:hypothetical protein D3C71_1151480 [compost metagenome]